MLNLDNSYKPGPSVVDGPNITTDMKFQNSRQAIARDDLQPETIVSSASQPSPPDQEIKQNTS
ncbi:hypothetical protein HPP92_013857 [Vanilla planifolia]|uniref:Uncharacterized protein n=1 Tax=Vanilla planifolia TaxID=51239 RepID=A0A835UZ94_VANPL|nr:hypothetical protein HPP92_013857 [Vanilla planifolia]